MDPAQGDSILGDLTLGDPILEDPTLGDPTLGDLTLGYPTLGDPTLEDPILEDPTLEDPTLEEHTLGALLQDKAHRILTNIARDQGQVRILALDCEVPLQGVSAKAPGQEVPDQTRDKGGHPQVPEECRSDTGVPLLRGVLSLSIGTVLLHEMVPLHEVVLLHEIVPLHEVVLLCPGTVHVDRSTHFPEHHLPILRMCEGKV